MDGVKLVAELKAPAQKAGQPQRVNPAQPHQIETLRDFTPALTTAQLPLSDLGRAAVHRVLADEVQAEPAVAEGCVLLLRSTELSGMYGPGASTKVSSTN